MTATITRSRRSDAHTPVTPAETPADRAPRVTPSQPQATDTPTQGNLGNMMFSVVTSEVIEPKRGLGRAKVDIPVHIKNAFQHMFLTNPSGGSDKMEVVRATMTNSDINRYLKMGGLKKLTETLPYPDRKYVKSSVVTIPGSPNPQSVAKEDAGKPVNIQWVVYRLSEDQLAEREGRRAERQANRTS